VADGIAAGKTKVTATEMTSAAAQPAAPTESAAEPPAEAEGELEPAAVGEGGESE